MRKAFFASLKPWCSVNLRVRLFELCLFVSIFHLIVSCDLTPKEERIAKPNFLFIFTDDQRYNTIHALGNEVIKTPHIDNLVNEGVTFTHAYNMGAWNGAVCVASRSMILTGLTVWNAERADSVLDDMVAEGRFWPQYLEKAGYDTYMTGKWHVNVKASDSFSKAKNVFQGMANQTPEGYHRPKSENDTLWQPWDTRFEGYWKEGAHWSELLANTAIEFLQTAEKKDNPFFMYLAFNAPHDPRQSPKAYIDMYPLEDIPLPESFMNIYPYHDKIGCGPGLRDEKLAPFPRTPYAVKKHIQEYYAIITHMDDQIGRIINALEKSGKMDNTYIIFTSDHGLAVGNHGLMGKQNMFDHSIRVPFIITGPGITKGKKIPQQIYLQDIMPTTLELAGIDIDSPIEYKSLMPILKDSIYEEVRKPIYGSYRHLQRMLRTEQFKLIVYPNIKKILLFDVINDPEELNDISDIPEYDTILTSLMKELIYQQKILNDPLDLSVYFSEVEKLKSTL